MVFVTVQKLLGLPGLYCLSGLLSHTICFSKKSEDELQGWTIQCLRGWFFLFFSFISLKQTFPSYYCDVQAKLISFCFSWGNAVSPLSDFPMSPVTAFLNMFPLATWAIVFIVSKGFEKKLSHVEKGNTNLPKQVVRRNHDLLTFLFDIGNHHFNKEDVRQSQY